MAETDNQAAASVETRAETQKSPSEFTKHWLQAIKLASDEEDQWRKDGTDAIERFSTSKPKSFNILYANTQTTVPALYNSEPVPDVRRRFGDDDEVGERVASILERAILIQAQMYDFDGCMKAAVRDRQLPGRGVTRVRVVKGQNGSSRVQCEQVVWSDFRRGPAKVWPDVPWTAFQHKMTREELVALSPKIGPQVQLDAVASDDAAKDKKAADLPDMFKRATVWEVWDKLERKVYWFAESFKDGPLSVTDDPYELRDFFCVPEPLYQVRRTDTLKPICEFTIWKPLADEVDSITARISGVIKVMKLRGLYDGTFAGLVEKLKGLDDGELAAADDAARAMQQGGIDKAVWMWPVETAIQVVQGLYEAREQAKNHLYELTGVADIMRGSTQANETATAQQIKTQWGSLRTQEGQRDVQRYARDLFRLMADLTAYALEPPEIQAMVGMSLAPDMPQNVPPEQQAQVVKQIQQAGEAAAKLLKSDLLREFAIDIETDSTIKADLSRAQENVAGFVTGLGTFAQSVVPMIEAQMMPPEVAMKFVSSFARNFKLGREADEAIDEWEKWLEDKAQQPPQPSPEQQKAQAVQAQTQMQMAAKQQEMQAKQQDRASELQTKQALAQTEIQKKQAELAIKQQQLEMERQQLAMEMQATQQQQHFNMVGMAAEHQANMQNMAAEQDFADQKRQADLQFMRQKQAAKPNGAGQ